MNQHERALEGKCIGSCRECAIEAAFNRGYNLGRTDQKNAAPPPKAKQYRDALRDATEVLETTLGNLRSLKHNAFRGVTTYDVWDRVVDEAIAKAKAVLR